MIHVYAVAEGLGELPEVDGLGHALLERMTVAGLDVVFSQADDEMTMDEEAVLRHALVVDALMERSEAILPGRLGPRFTSAEDLAAAVSERAETLRDLLNRVAGCVELGLRVLQPEHPSPGSEPGGGGEYLRERLEAHRASTRRALELHEPLSRLVRASTTREGQAGGDVLEAAYLVPADRVDRFREELVRLEDSARELEFVCTGPWPPYSFASAEGM